MRRQFRAQKLLRAIEMRPKLDALLRNLTQVVKRENLKSAAVG